VTQDNDPEALSIRFISLIFTIALAAKFYRTGGDVPFPETATARNITSFQADFSQSKIGSVALIATASQSRRLVPPAIEASNPPKYCIAS